MTLFSHPQRFRTALAASVFVAVSAASAQTTPTQWYRFDEGSPGSLAGAIVDSGSAGLGGVASGGSLYSADVHGQVSCTGPAALGTSLAFNGTDQYVNMPGQFPLIAPGDVTIAFWFKAPCNGHQAIFWSGMDTIGGPNFMQLFVNSDATFGYNYAGADGVLHAPSGDCCPGGGMPIPRNAWAHLMLTRQDNTYRVYLNGTLMRTGTDSNPNLPTAGSWAISGRSPFRYNGLLDDVRFYSAALTPAQIFLDPALTAQPASQIVSVGLPTTFAITAAGTASFNYSWQWQPEGTGTGWKNLTDGTNSDMVGPALTAQNVGTASLKVTALPGFARVNPRSVRCIVSNFCNSVTSDPATITLTNPLEFLDPNPALLRADPEHSYGAKQVQPTSSISWSFDRMATVASSITGAACDGVTRVLVRWEVPGGGSATFSIADESDAPVAVGTLAPPGQTPRGTTLANIPSVPANGKWYAFAEYIVPTDFWRSVNDANAISRPVKFKADFVPSAGGATVHATKFLDLVRPPIVLLHGFRGSAASWNWALQQDIRFVVYRENYDSSSQEPFQLNIKYAKSGAVRAVGIMRQRGYAATQASIVGHSMGGILARLHASNRSHDYYRAGNLGQGDYCKMITLYTPHFGSGWACLAETPVGLLVPHDQICISCGAVHDLRPDSAEIQNLLTTNVPSHAIAGIGGNDWLSINANSLYQFSKRDTLTFLVQWLSKAFQQDVADLTGSSQHDTVVGSVSAFGGLGTASRTEVPWVLNQTLGIHTTGPEENYVGDQFVRPLLDEPVGSAKFAHGFPANSSVPIPTICTTNRSVPTLLPAANGGLVITSPASGTFISEGASLQVSVQATGGFQPVSTAITSPLGSFVSAATPATATLSIPPDAVGPYVIQAFAIDSLSQVALATGVTINVTSSAVLQSIEVLTPWASIGHASDQFQLTVLGQFSGGIIRDLTSAATGTQYASSDTAVVMTDLDGKLLAQHEGTARIFIHNGEFQTYADVVVSHTPCFADLNGDRLVDDADFSFFVVQYDILDCSDPSMPPACVADLNADTLVDDSDFVIFIAAYNDLLCP